MTRAGVGLLLAALFSAASFVGWPELPCSGDRAEMLNGAARVVAGQRPYLDFWLLQPPGEVWLPALLLRFGGSTNAVLAGLSAISVAIGLAAYAIALRMGARPGAAAVLASIAFFAGVPVVHLGPTYIHAYLLLVLPAVSAVALAAPRAGLAPWIAAGAAIGAAAGFRTDYAGAAGVALCIFALADAHARGTPARGALLRIAVLVTTGAGVFALFALPFADAPGRFADAVFLDSVGHGTARHRGLLETTRVEIARRAERIAASGDAWTRLVAGSAIVTDLASRAVLVLGLGATALLAVRRPRGARWDAIRPALPFLLWGALVSIRPLIHGGLVKVVHATTPFLFAGMALLLASRGARRLAAWRAATLLAVALLASAPVFVARAFRESAAARHEVVFAHGRLRLANAAEAHALGALRDALAARAPANPDLIVTPWSAPPLNALTGMRNPTHWDSIIDLVFRPSPESAQAWCASAVAARAAVVSADVVGSRPLPASCRANPGCARLADCLDAHFRLAETYGAYELWLPLAD